MTVTHQLKILDNKIMANQAQYDLDRLAAKISTYSSGDLRKQEYLSGEDLGYKPSVFDQAKFDYSLLGNIFSERSDKDEIGDQRGGSQKIIEDYCLKLLLQMKKWVVFVQRLMNQKL